MEKKKYRYVDVIDCNDTRCVHCGYHNEISGSLLDLVTYWIEIDNIELNCIKCGKPFHVLKGRQESCIAAAKQQCNE